MKALAIVLVEVFLPGGTLLALALAWYWRRKSFPGDVESAAGRSTTG